MTESLKGISIRNLKYLGSHKEFKNVKIYKDIITKTIYYKGEVRIKYRRFCKFFDTAIKASKYVDLKYLELKVPQKNESYKIK